MASCALLPSLWAGCPLQLCPSSGKLLSLLGGFCLNKLCGTEAGLQIVEKMLRFIYANVRRRRSARVNLLADKACVHSCAKESGVDRVSWSRGEGGIFNFMIPLS